MGFIMAYEEAVISKHILAKWVERDPFVARLVEVLEGDEEVAELLRMSNINAVLRLGYNDHGPVHARIVAGTALELFHLLLAANVEPTSLVHGTAKNLDEVKAILVFAAYLHDVGNAIHRDMHEHLGALFAKDILDRLLPRVLGDIGPRRFLLRQEVMGAIFSTDYSTRALTVEAGIVKVADGLDMSEGRARIPYEMGKVDIHALSALSIKRVSLSRGLEKPVRITVKMDDLAGYFQVEKVLMPKIRLSGLQGYIELEVYARENKLHVPL